MDLKALSKQDLGALTQNTNSHPTQALAFLKGASDDIKEVGKDQVRGAETTHYKATIDVSKAIASQPADKREPLEKLFEGSGMTSFPADVWIDAEGRMRKMQYVIKVKTGAAGPATVDTTLELFDFGSPVDVEAPPASETADLDELLGQG
jgi:hypothetical protein